MSCHRDMTVYFASLGSCFNFEALVYRKNCRVASLLLAHSYKFLHTLLIKAHYSLSLSLSRLLLVSIGFWGREREVRLTRQGGRVLRLGRLGGRAPRLVRQFISLWIQCSLVAALSLSLSLSLSLTHILSLYLYLSLFLSPFLSISLLESFLGIVI